LNTVKYEIVEKDERERDRLLSLIMGKHLVQGIAYFCLVESHKPMSPAEMTEFLGLSDTSHTERFNEAVADLVTKGLIRKASKVRSR
jgi:predicted transcriptional regulator